MIVMIGVYPPISVPVLTIVAAMITQNVAKIDWKNCTESIPGVPDHRRHFVGVFQLPTDWRWNL